MIPEVLGLYAQAPVRVRARAWGRWASTPFARVEAKVPRAGRILEVGSGVGVFVGYLALCSERRDVLGIDEDLDDVLQARLVLRRAGSRAARVHFALTPPGEIPAGPWDAVVLIDVLGRVEADAREGLVHTCAGQLALGGVLIVKDNGDGRRWKPVLPGRAARVGPWMQEAGLVVSEEPIDRGYPQPHHLFVGARRRSVG